MNIINLSLVQSSTVFALLITWLILPVTAGAKMITSPLTASFLTHEQLVIPTPTCLSQIGGVTTGTGISSLLGQVSLEAKDCITPVQNYFSFIGKMTFTMSNGAELFADYSGLFTPTSFPSISVLTNSTFKITGGTGSFLGASGGGKLIGGENITTGQGLMQATGTLSSNFKKDKNTGSQQTNSFVADTLRNSSFDAAAIAKLDTNIYSHELTLGQYFFSDQYPQLLAENAVPEATSLSLLGIGLASLVAIRRRKSHRFPVTRHSK